MTKYFGTSLFILLLLFQAQDIHAHPLRLSLSQIEYSDEEERLTISLRLFLMDVREALVFDPDNTELAFCQPNESKQAEPMLLNYLRQYFFVEVNGQNVDLKIKGKQLSGEGINVALEIQFEYALAPPLRSMRIKNAVFTDLFFDQSNVVYVHVNEENRSLMLNKETPVHELEF